MSLHETEQLQAAQNSIFSDLRHYVANQAQQEELHVVEEHVWSMLFKLGRRLLQESISHHNKGDCGSQIIKNDQILRRQQPKSRDYQSIFGTIRIERSYYWSAGSEQKGYFPLDERLNLPASKCSYFLQELLQSQIVEQPYDQAMATFSKLLPEDLWKRTHNLLNRDIGGEVEAFYEQKESPDEETEGPVLCMTADCKGIRMVPSEKPESKVETPKPRRKKGDKCAGLRRDAVVTADYSFLPGARRPEDLAAHLMKESTTSTAFAEDVMKIFELRKPLNKQVMAHMSGKEHAFDNLIMRIMKRDPSGKKDIIALFDGEAALEARLREVIKKHDIKHRIRAVILDIYHVSEYVWEAGTTLFGEKSQKRTPWVKQTLLKILKGNVGRVIGGLRQIITKRKRKLSKTKREKLQRIITYFENHRHMMKYGEYLEQGYPIATGVVEGACGSLVKDRTDRSGMKWQKSGAQPLLHLRAVKKNGDWDDFWKFYTEKQKAIRYSTEAA